MIHCPHRPPCPGCPRLGDPELAADAHQVLAALARDTGVGAVQLHRGPPTGFRHRARLAVRGRAASPKIGIFEEGSHRVVDIPRCVVHHPLINEVAGELRRALSETRTPTYSDDAHLGLVRYVQIAVERRTTTAQVVLVTASESPEPARPALDALARRLGPRLHSLFWNGNPARTNAILGPHWAHLAGPPHLEERFSGVGVFYPPGAFGQSHLPLADELVSLVHGFVPPGRRVLELYAGVGPIGLPLVERSSAVVLNEVAEGSLEGLSLGVAALPPGVRDRARVVAGPAAEAAAHVRSVDVVVVDPPRRGLDAAVIDALVRDPPELLVYVACGLPAFLRDSTTLMAGGRLALRELHAVDLFPYTEHVEVVARFTRGSS